MIQELLYFYFLGKCKASFVHVRIPDDKRKAAMMLQKISPLISFGVTSLLISFWWKFSVPLAAKLGGALVIIIAVHALLIRIIYSSSCIKTNKTQ